MLRKILSAAAVLIGAALAPSFAWAACGHTMVILNGASASVNLCQGTDGSGNVYSLFGMIGGTNGANAWNVNSDGTADLNAKTWAGTTLGAPSNYGTSPGAVTVPGVNAFVTNTPTVNLGTIGTASTAANQSTANTALAAIQTSTAATATALGNPVPAGTNQIGNVGIVYPAGSTPITASATGTTAATTATLAANASLHTFICGFAIRANATAAATGNSTVTGTVTGTLNFTQWTAPNASGIGLTEEIFSPCITSSATNTGIAVVSAAPGTGGVVSVTAWGYQGPS